MLQPTPGFIPPPVPLAPAAANGILSTGGVLAGAAAGAKAGAVLGPKGALAGAAAGALLAPLLLPLPTAPGTLPPQLDPGLEGPSPDPWTPPIPGPDGFEVPFPLPPDSVPGTIHKFKLIYRKWQKQSASYSCTDGSFRFPGSVGPVNNGYPVAHTVNGQSASFTMGSTSWAYVCGSATGTENAPILTFSYVNADGDDRIYPRGSSMLGKTGTKKFSRRWTIDDWVEILGFETDDVPHPTPWNDPPPRPKPKPIIPAPLPTPAPVPGPVPIPEPEPQPQPLEVPSPDNPDAPPITIPQAPPAPPQPVPGPGPQPGPLPSPNRPAPIAPPLPVPGVPTVPEPSPDPDVSPVPGPAPTPDPGPSPAPDTDPEPGRTPIPVPPGIPVPTVPSTPTTPDTALPTVPDGNVAPQPTPAPVPTPPNVHFPQPGQPGVNPGGTRPDITAIAQEVGRIEQKVASQGNVLNNIPWQLILAALQGLEDLLAGPTPGTTYTLTGVCEEPDDDGNQPVFSTPVGDAPGLEAIQKRIDALPQILQQHLAYKTPTCGGTLQSSGDWRTISFRSENPSPYGKSRLRKRFRYRSFSGNELPAVVDHWRNFTWVSGPVVVKHLGAAWGTPQVWAVSADEGKRVIRHAAGEAGIDPDQVGRWEVGGSNSSRLGVSDTMRVDITGGYYWITARDGSSERPIVEIVKPEPGSGFDGEPDRA